MWKGDEKKSNVKVSKVANSFSFPFFFFFDFTVFVFSGSVFYLVVTLLCLSVFCLFRLVSPCALLLCARRGAMADNNSGRGCAVVVLGLQVR